MMAEISELAIGSFLLALAISLLVVPVSIWVFKKLGWVVDPKKAKHPAHIHKKPVPKGGGIAIFAGVMVVAVKFMPLDKHLIAILGAMLITVLIGVWDDVKSLNPYLRLGTNFLAAAVVVASGIGIAYISNPLGGMIDLSWPRFTIEVWGKFREIWLWPDIFALLWIPFLMNAINWSSGVDGQVSGVVAVAAIMVGLISLNYSADITQWPVIILAMALAGSFAGLSLFSFFPQKIMPGYSATSLAGLLLGVLSILSTAKIGTLMVVLGVPLIDSVYVMGRRVMSKRSPVWGDKSHFHHRLMQLGWGKRRIALFYWLTTAGLGWLALKVDARKKLLAMLGLGGLMALFLLWRYLSPYLKRQGQGNG